MSGHANRQVPASKFNLLNKLDILYESSWHATCMLQCGPAVADARWPTSKMDFRSNEAGRAGSYDMNTAAFLFR
jgi:hypothetical protein